MHTSVMNYGKQFINADGKSVIEVGSLNVNGSWRKFARNAKSYWGVDIVDGKDVDEVLPAEQLVERFGSDSFDLVLCSEMLEHAENWRECINNMKHIGSEFVITTRSKGFPEHAFPDDWWRYEVEDFEQIFSDLDIHDLRKDDEQHGVMLYATKPDNWQPADLSDVHLYSMKTGKR